MRGNDFSYITPGNLESLQASVLLQTADQYRRAAELLVRNPAAAGDELRTELLRAVDLIERELSRRADRSTSGTGLTTTSTLHQSVG